MLYAQWDVFKERKVAPSFSEKYYNSMDNPFGTCGGAGNCTWYAYGRAYEILGYKPCFAGNAKEWWNNRESFKGYTTDVSQPRVGALMVWGNTNYNGAGHVAIVEEILEDGRIVYSESSYGGLWYYAKGEKYLNTYNWYGNAVQYWGTSAMTTTQISNVEDVNGIQMGFVGYIYLQ